MGCVPIAGAVLTVLDRGLLWFLFAVMRFYEQESEKN